MARSSSARSLGAQQPYGGLFLVKPKQQMASQAAPLRAEEELLPVAPASGPTLLYAALSALAVPALWMLGALLHALNPHL